MNVNWTRRNVIATIIVGLISCIVPVAIYFHDKNSDEIGTETDETSDTSVASLPSVSIISIHLSDVAMNVPAVFEIGIKVSGYSIPSAKDIHVIMDFGRAEVLECGYSPTEIVGNYVQVDKSYRRLDIVEIRENEILYIRCLLNTPTFKLISIASENISQGKSISLEEYKKSLLSEPLGFWKGLGGAFVVFLFIVLCLKIIGIVFFRE